MTQITASLTPDALDEYARRYYLDTSHADLDIEELAQLRLVGRITESLGLRPGERVLEMGWGTGIVAPELCRLVADGVHVEVVEGSPLLVAEGRSRLPEVAVHEAMFEDFEPAQPFDAVLCLFILEHVDDPAAVLRRAARWLRPGGSLVAAVPNAESLHRQVAVRMGMHERLDDLSPRDHLVGHQRVYTLEGLAADAEAAGLVVRDRFGGFVKPVPNALMVEWPPELLSAMHDISDLLPPALLGNIAIRAERP
jgi:2-polyprenyl-3-methyl-5-hydroxy-6-metoxy-1,4-benzoquinol methylase